MVALEASYEEYVELNGGEFCGICGRKPSGSRRLDRDHDHSRADVNIGRGLLCNRCNRGLPAWVTVEWLERATGYLNRYLERVRGESNGTV
jgi:hypothetical protein